MNNTTTVRVMLIEDNADVADSTASLVADWGYSTQVERDPVRALQMAEDYRPHVVLLDLGLPRMHGYEVARKLRERPWARGIRLIALTGWGQETDRHQSMLAGIHHHLVKPLVPSVLERILAGVVPTEE